MVKLSIHEIIYLLKTWNSWYLIEHDNYLKSDFSENEVKIEIIPFKMDSLDESIINDLTEYTDGFDLKKPDAFSITFLFSAWEHQSDEIFAAIRPVIEKSEGAKISIVNSMYFTEKDLPEREDVLKNLDPKIKEEIEKLKRPNDEPQPDDYSGVAEGEDKEETPRHYTGNQFFLKNRLVIKGTIINGEVEADVIPVSYTHLTLPTIYSV